ncbi:MAG: flagellar hook-length control protein FliK [Pseudomonadota bacterium]
MLDLAAVKPTSRAADAPSQSDRKPVNGRSDNGPEQEFQSAYDSAAEKTKDLQERGETTGEAPIDDTAATEERPNSDKSTTDEVHIVVAVGEGQSKAQDGKTASKEGHAAHITADGQAGRNRPENAGSAQMAPSSDHQSKGPDAIVKPGGPAAAGPEDAAASAKEAPRKTPAEAIVLSKAADTGQRSTPEAASAPRPEGAAADAAKQHPTQPSLASIARAEAKSTEAKKNDRIPRDTEVRPANSKPKASVLSAGQGATLIAKPQTLSVAESRKEKADLIPLLASDGETFATWETRSSSQAPSSALGQVLNRPETPSMIARQMAEALQKLPDRPVEISLNPKELGRVRMNISAAEAGITVSIVAERPETLDLMRRHIEDLTREFQSIGYEDIAFAFAEGEQNSAYTEHQSDDGPADLSRLVIAEEDTAEPIQPMTSATNGIDIRL